MLITKKKLLVRKKVVMYDFIYDLNKILRSNFYFFNFQEILLFLLNLTKLLYFEINLI